MAAKKCRVHKYWGCIVCPSETEREQLVTFPTLDNMSPNEYVRFAKENDTGCPVCRSRDVVHDFENQSSSDMIEQDVFCRDCECRWKEEFHIVTYTDVKYPKEKASE